MALEHPISLDYMAPHSGLLIVVDEWSGGTNTTKRRRIQNRINQRAYRKRKREEAKQRQSRITKPSLRVCQSGSPDSSEASSNVPIPETDTERISQTEMHSSNELWDLFHCAAGHKQLDRQKISHLTTICNSSSLEQQRAISQFAKWVDTNQKLSSPHIDQLLVLVKFNVLRALVSNGVDLGYPSGALVEDDDALSPLADRSKPNWLSQSVPTALQPTALQRKIPHHPWIDLFPAPEMRDNLLQAGDAFDDIQLCADLVGYHNEGVERTGMIVWGEPWDIGSWEVTEAYVKTWGWTLKGCKQLLQATNYWRERRGERPLQADRIFNEED